VKENYNKNSSNSNKNNNQEKPEAGSITVGLNKLNSINFSTKNRKNSDTNFAALSIKKPFDSKGKYEDKKSFSSRKRDNEDKDRKRKLIIIEEKEDRSTIAEESINFEAFFDEELKEKEEEKQRELRRMRIEHIKKMNENVDVISNKDDNAEVLSLQGDICQDEISKTKLPSKIETNNNNKIKDDEKSLLVIKANKINF